MHAIAIYMLFSGSHEHLLLINTWHSVDYIYRSEVIPLSGLTDPTHGLQKRIKVCIDIAP